MIENMRKIEELRHKFQEKLKHGTPDVPDFDPRDLIKVKDDTYLTRVIEHCESNVDESFKMLWSTLIWRMNNKVNEIKDTVRMDYVKEGLFFPHGRDIDGCLLFVLKWKLCNKGQRNIEDLKKVILYWLERMEKEENGKPFTLFFDLEGCGLNNIEVELVTYMISILKNYYPKFVNYIIIYQMPWMMTAAYRILKGLLPAKAVERLRVVNKDKLKDLVPLNQALKCWGGNDEYTFQFVPERNSNETRRVTFADVVNARGKGVVEIIPNDYVTFTVHKNDIKSELTVTNVHNEYVAFKMRTTGPEKFKVKPTSGILTPNSVQRVSIGVLPGFDLSAAVTERFLVLTTVIPDDKVSQKHIDEVWRNPNCKVNEHRLKCKVLDDVNSEQKSTVMETFDILQGKYVDLYHSVAILKLFVLIGLGFSVLLVVFGYLIYRRTLIYV